MSVNVKNPETERLVRELVARTGETVTAAITESVRQRLAQLDDADTHALDDRLRALNALSQDAAPRWTIPYGAADHGAMLYDDHGLPVR